MSPTPPTGVVDAASPRREAVVPGTDRTWRRRMLRSVAFVVVLGAAAALTGCQVNNTPTGYVTPEAGTIVQTNFVAACTGNIPSDAGTTTSIAPANKCNCMYNVFVTSVPFDDGDKKNNPAYANWGDAPTFVSLEKDLTNDPGAINKLPPAVTSALKTCESDQVGPGTTVG